MNLNLFHFNFTSNYYRGLWFIMYFSVNNLHMVMWPAPHIVSRIRNPTIRISRFLNCQSEQVFFIYLFIRFSKSNDWWKFGIRDWKFVKHICGESISMLTKCWNLHWCSHLLGACVEAFTMVLARVFFSQIFDKQHDSGIAGLFFCINPVHKRSNISLIQIQYTHTNYIKFGLHQNIRFYGFSLIQ